MAASPSQALQRQIPGHPGTVHPAAYHVLVDGDGGSDQNAQFLPPAPHEALARLGMPMEDAMRTQRAVRRLHLEPVSHEVLLPLLELSLKAPTSSDTQDWHYVVVEDAAQKARLAKLYRRLYRVINPIIERRARGDERERRTIAPGQWQAENFEQLPAFVIPCYRRGLKHRPVGPPSDLGGVLLRFGFPCCSESAAGVPGSGPRRVSSDTADLVGSRGATHSRVASQHSPGLHHPHRLGQGTLRSHYPETYR